MAALSTIYDVTGSRLEAQSTHEISMGYPENVQYSPTMTHILFNMCQKCTTSLLHLLA
jgi:hypothetical protein